jgi:PAS domain S-box-containing protein
MPTDPHPLLALQLRQLGLAPGQVPDAQAFGALLVDVSRVYADLDRERHRIERSRAMASHEAARLNRTLQASQAQLASLLSLSADWVWEQNAKGRFTFVSDELQQRTGLDNVILLGQACSVEGPLRVSPGELVRLRAQMAARQPFHDCVFELTAADGRLWHMSISGTPLFEGGVFRGYRGVGSDITAAVEEGRVTRELARRKLQSQLDFTSRLLEVNPTPLFVKDECGRFVNVNAAWLELMGLKRDQVIGRNSSDLYGEEGPRHMAYDESLLRSEDRVRYENRLLRPGRPPRDTVVTKVRFMGADGSPAGIIGSIIDVTEFREAERATRDARDAAESANRAKSEFVANISHELRTPLQTIVGCSELGVMRSGAEPRWQSLFADIHAGGMRMLTLVNELLDLSKAGDLAASLDLQPHDLGRLAADVAQELAPLAAQRGLRIELRQPPGPLPVQVDGFRIQQVIRNVLANALRFAPAGSGIELEARAAADAGAELVVRDRGPGIPADELEAIFDAFVQSTRTRNGSGGTGLGLTICRKIMCAHGGSIVAANAEGGGARVTIHLPGGPH